MATESLTLQESTPGTCRLHPVRTVLALVLWATAFGYVEAALVVDLHLIYDPIRATLYPDHPPEALLPLITFEQFRAMGPEHARAWYIELGREVATMLMLATAASLAARRRGEWMPMFLIAFGVWDIAYYVGLRGMIGFPESLLTWDILFLLPVPWLSPVLAPVIVAATMIGSGLAVLAAIARGGRPRGRWYHWSAMILGALIIIAGFCQPFLETPPGEMPGRFNWIVFGAGEALALFAFIHAMIQSRRTELAACKKAQL